MTTIPERWSKSADLDDWVETDKDPRAQLPDPIGEKQTLDYYLRTYRMALEMKCDGLDAEQLARRSVPPSTMSLLGLVRHMTEVERHWFVRVLQQQSDLGPVYDDSEDPDVDFNGAAPDPAVVAEAWKAWREQVAVSEKWLDALPEDGLGQTVPRRDKALPVRDILVHLIEEYARHVGHADLLRETIDGRVGQ